MEEKKKNKYALIVAIALVLVLLVTGTFAWLRIGTTATKTNIIKAGSLDLELDDATASGIRLENAVPQTYQQGIQNQSYSFVLKNNSTIAADYTLSLNDLYEGADAAAAKLADKDIRYVLVKDGVGQVASNSKLLSTGRTIDSGTIAGKSGDTPTTITYTLYIWIDSMAGDDGTEADIMNRIFNAKLNLIAEQHHEAATTSSPYVYATNEITNASDGSSSRPGNMYLKYELTDGEIASGTEPEYCIYSDNINNELCLKDGEYETSVQKIKTYFGYDSSTWTRTVEDEGTEYEHVGWQNSENDFNCGEYNDHLGCADNHALLADFTVYVSAYSNGSIKLATYTRDANNNTVAKTSINSR